LEVCKIMQTVTQIIVTLLKNGKIKFTIETLLTNIVCKDILHGTKYVL
jgi:hypothetical protein